MSSAATADSGLQPIPVRPPFAHLPVWSAVVVIGVLLTVLAPRYGYHRDEL